MNIGGFLALNDWDRFEETRNLVVVYEGLNTYGGLAVRDMEAIARGIEEAVQEDHIKARIGRWSTLGGTLRSIGIPIVLPVGGHPISLDAKKFLPQIKQLEFPTHTLAAELYLESGICSMEQGIVSAGRNKDTGDHDYPKLELVRLTFPRCVYTQAHCDVTAEAAEAVFDWRAGIKGMKMTYEPNYFRFFQARFERLK